MTQIDPNTVAAEAQALAADAAKLASQAPPVPPPVVVKSAITNPNLPMRFQGQK